jgi:hypothetical protein
MSEILKCAQCGNKLRQFPGARFTICSYCGFQTNFEQPKPAPVYNDYSDHSTQNVYNYRSPEPARISRVDPRSGKVTYRDEEVDTSKFIGLALLTLFTVGFALPVLQTYFIARSLKNGYWSRHKAFGAVAIAATWIVFFGFIAMIARYGLVALLLFVAWIIGFLAWRAEKR